MSLAETELKYYAPLGNASALSRIERGIVLNVGEERFRVEVIRADVLKLAISQAGRFDEQPTFAVASLPTDNVKFEVEDGADAVTLRTSALRLVITKRAFGLAAYRADGTVIFEDEKDDAGQSRGFLQLNDNFLVSRTMGLHEYAAVEPSADVQQEWNDALQQRMKRTVWTTGGCSSWYLDDHGRNTVLWPRSTVSFRRNLAEFDVAAYDVSAARTPDPEGISA